MSKLPKHILVIRLSAMGDVAMTVPVLRAFIQQYPEVKITVLTKDFFKPFFKDLPNVNVFAAEVKGKHKGILGLFQLSKELKVLNTSTPFNPDQGPTLSTGIDAIADLHNVLRSKILKMFLRSYPFFQIDKGRKEKSALISGVYFKPLKTTHQRYTHVFKHLGFKIDLSNPTFPEKAVLAEKTEVLLKTDKNRRIGIAPFAAYESKMYPLDLMREVIKELSKEYQVILFGGGKKEVELLNDMESRFQNVINIAGKLALDQELDVISNLDLMLSMDSGNGHIAAMLGVKVVTIWGVTHPHAGFAPFNQPEAYGLLPSREEFPKIPTSVYGNKYPEHYAKAAGSISPETVINTIKNLLT